MTESTKEPRDIKIGEDWATPASEGFPRRTIVHGAVWSIPLISLAVATPADAASTTQDIDLAITSILWNAQGGQGDVPANDENGSPTFNGGNGLYADITIVNNGPGTVNGVSLNFGLTTIGHDVDPNSATRPRIDDPAWSFVTIPSGSTTNRSTAVFTNPSLVLAPGQTAVIRVLYYTTTNGGVVDDKTFPDAYILPADGQNDTDTGNNYGRPINEYNVRT